MIYFEALVTLFFTLYAYFDMEAHPIPQNVTTFEFRLIGDMTLKQFMYLAFGMVVAYINFVFLANSIPLIAWPIIIISSSLGVAFAFLPISDRPLDHWLGAFIKAVYSPTKRVWAKAGHAYQNDPFFIKRLDLYNKTYAPVTLSVTPMPKVQPFPAVTTAPAPLPLPQNPPSPEVLTTEELSKTVELAKQAQNLQMQIVQTQRKLETVKTVGAMDDINKILTNLNQLVSQASQIKQQLASVTHELPQAPQVTVKLQTVAAPRPRQTQIVLTSTQNVINGIITDTSGTYLDAVVVVIYDKDGLPVRALKTNKLGQFSGATPLPNGQYTIQLEKDNLSFDVLQINLEGKVLPPILISAKKLLPN